MSEKEIDLDKDMLFTNQKTGEIGIGEIVYEEVVLEGFRGVPSESCLDVNWKFGGMDTSYDSHIQKFPLSRFKELPVQGHKAGKRRGWFFRKNK